MPVIDDGAFRLFVQSVRDYAILMLDPTGRIVTWNEGAERLKGYRPDQILGRHFSCFYPQADVDARKPERELEVARAHGRLEDEGWRVRRDGSRFWANVVITALWGPDGELRGYGKVTRDLTERRAMERRQRALAKRFSNLIESAPDAIVIVGPDGKIELVNAQTEAMFGYARDELVGRSAEMLVPERVRGADHHDRWPFQAEQRSRAAQDGQDLYGARKDGSEFPLEVSLSPLDTEDGTLTSSTIRDVTDRKQVEAELRRHRGHLEELVAERTVALTATNQELEAFSYSVSHDLRAPLRSITGFSSALVDDYGAALDADAIDYLTRIQRAAERMSTLLDGLLALSRVARGDFERVHVDLGAIAREIADDLQAADPDRRARVEVAERLTAMGDSRLIRIALENLLRNAWKFSSGEPVTAIEVGRTELDGRPAFFVSDNGVGFEMAYANKLFGAFQRLHGHDEFPGTGIGLATVQRIVHRHGGQIVPESVVGEGAKFTFTL